MNVARSGSEGFWRHVAENPKDGTGGVGIYIRVGADNNSTVIPRDEAVALMDGLREVLGDESQ